MVDVLIEGYNLPSIRFEDHHTNDVKEPVHIGIQKGKDTLCLTPADKKTVQFKCQLRVKEGKDGTPNFLGPYAHGKPADRHLYLGWLVGDKDILENRFRRIKIKLNTLTWTDINSAVKNNAPLTVRINLTDKHGGPACAKIKEQIWGST